MFYIYYDILRIISSQGGHADCVAALLDSGAVADARGGLGPAAGPQYRGGLTPLHWAACAGAADAVRLLLRRGAQVRGRALACVRARRASCVCVCVCVCVRVRVRVLK